MSDQSAPDNMLLVVIIEKSFDLEVSEAFEQAGVKAFTRLEGTGSGVWQQLDRWVDPEKLIYITVIDRDQLPAAFRYLRTTAQLDKPGVGIAFTLPVFEGIGVGIPLHED